MEFRVKSDLRNHQAIVQPRLYDCLIMMVTQITLTLKTSGNSQALETNSVGTRGWVRVGDRGSTATIMMLVLAH